MTTHATSESNNCSSARCPKFAIRLSPSLIDVSNAETFAQLVKSLGIRSKRLCNPVAPPL